MKRFLHPEIFVSWRWWSALMLAALLVLGVTHEQVMAAQAEDPGTARARPLAVQQIGADTARAWYKLLPPGRVDDQTPWRQLISYKTGHRTQRQLHFASVDFASGTVNLLPGTVPVLEVWSHLWLDGKLYIGTNVPAHLLRYDPATDELTDYGPLFERTLTVYKIAVSPDGMLALGGGNGTELATYDPRTEAIRHYGAIGGSGANFIYSLSMDEKYIYTAVRGREPWELVVIDRETGERHVRTTAPPALHMTVSGNVAQVPVAAGQPRLRYLLRDGAIHELAEGERPAGWDLPGSGFTGAAPPLYIDDSPIMEDRAELALLITTDSGEIARVPLAVGLDVGDGSGYLIRTDAGNIAMVGRARFPMLLVDPATGQSRRIPMAMTSAYNMVGAKGRLFITGYPSANLVVFDPDRPVTLEQDMPGQPGIERQSEEANPRLFHYLSSETGGAHIGVCLTPPLADGRMYLIARRHRYYDGFALASFDPQTLETAVFDDQGAFDHLQIGWMAPIDEGRRLVIATYLQPNRQLDTAVPEVASLFIYDVASGRITAHHQPLPDATRLLAVEQVGPDLLVGTALAGDDQTTTLYRFDLASGRTQQTRTYRGVLVGTIGTLGVPVRANDFVLGPDGRIWTGMSHGRGTVLFRIDPATLAMEPLGQVEGSFIRLLFDDGQVYLSGAPHVRRLLAVD